MEIAISKICIIVLLFGIGYWIAQANSYIEYSKRIEKLDNEIYELNIELIKNERKLRELRRKEEQK